MLRHPVRRRRVRLATAWLAVAAAGPLLTVAGPLLAAAAQGAGRPVVVAAEIDALIHPVSAEFIAQTISRADDEDAELVVLVLRTPGGLVDSTRDINTSIIEAETPVVVVRGSERHAGRVGRLPDHDCSRRRGHGTGDAHRRRASGVGQRAGNGRDGPPRRRRPTLQPTPGRWPASASANVELAEKAVTDSQSFTEREALEAEPPLIDLVAADLDALIDQLDGREVRRWDGDTVTLRTAGARVEQVEMNWRQRLLSAVAHPQVAVLLFSLGTLGLTIELWNPGAILPGIVGGLCLLLAFFAFQILPINYVGLLLILFGLALLVAEMLTATYGLLATGGLVAMVLGALMVIDSPAPEMQLGWPFILPSMLALGLIVMLLTRLGVRSQLTRPVTGRSGMLEQPGRTTEPIPAGGAGTVLTHGELWSATSDEEIGADEPVRIVAVEGMRLVVKRQSEQPPGGPST